MKKVLFIGMSPNYGGIETFIINIFSRLNKQGFKFEFLNNFKKPLAYSDFINKHGGIIRHAYIDNGLLVHFNRYRIAYNFFLNHHDYDIVHVNAVSINVLFWIKAAQQFGIKKLIIHSHNNKVKFNSILINLLTKILSVKNRYYLNHHNIMELSASEESGEWMFHNHNFEVVRNGVDTNRFLPNPKLRIKLKKYLNISMNDNVVITVARMEYQKNYFRIIHIFNNINKLLPDTKLVIIGDGSEKLDIYKLVCKLGLKNKVIFLGIIDNVNEVLNIADLMLLPSKYEAFPYSLVEMQAMGVPSLVSLEAVPKTVNITDKIQYASLYNDNYYWANKAIKLLKKPYNIKEAKEMNYKIAESKYSIEYLTEQIKNIYLK